MPSETIRITKDQRDALYEQVRNHLGAVGDLWLALETNEDTRPPSGWRSSSPKISG